MPDRDREMPLGGLITAAVRAGNTVRRPAAPGAAAVAALLAHLESAGLAEDIGYSLPSWPYPR
jgi:hypothetical protein